MKIAIPQGGLLSSLSLIRTFGAQRECCSARQAAAAAKSTPSRPRHERQRNESDSQAQAPAGAVLAEEEAEIARNAKANLPVAVFLRTIGQDYEARSILDNRRVEELLRINGDLGRLGGLLKLWLTNDERTVEFGEATIRAVLSKIESTQEQMQSVMREVLIPKAER